MDWLTGLWDTTSDFFAGQPWLGALVVIGVFAVLARITDRLLSGTIRRLVARSETDLDDRFVELLHRPVFTTVALIGLMVATGLLDLDQSLERWTLVIIRTLLLIPWVSFALRTSRLLLEAMQRHERRFGFVRVETVPLLGNTFSVLVFLAAVYSLLVIWGVNITGLLASAGIVGLALSFAAQDTLSNLFAGVAILADRPYEVGDFIVIDGTERGQVTHIGLRSTRMLTRDDVEISIPNSVMGSSKIVNEAGGPPSQFRVGVSVGVSYGVDVDEVIAVLAGIGSDHPDTLSSPAPQVRFRQFGSSSLDFDLLCWITDPGDKGRVIHELNREVYLRFAEAGITIPFPQQDIHIKEMP